MHTLIIQAEQLNSLLPNTNIRILDFGKKARFDALHIPYALHVDATLLQNQTEYLGFLPPLSNLEQLFASLGHSSEVEYIVYDDDMGSISGRFLWVLDSIGHSKYRYLDGGIKSWLHANLPLSKSIQPVTQTAVNLSINHDATITKDELLQYIQQPNINLWDARSADEYTGKTQYATKAGHIPGAKNLEWIDLIDENLKIKTQAKQMISDTGLNTNQELIVYCQTHRRSGLAYLVAKELGIKVRAYAGSWNEWGNDSNAPAEL